VAELHAEPTGDFEQVPGAGFHLVAEALDGPQTEMTLATTPSYRRFGPEGLLSPLLLADRDGWLVGRVLVRPFRNREERYMALAEAASQASSLGARQRHHLRAASRHDLGFVVDAPAEEPGINAALAETDTPGGREESFHVQRGAS
jgi:hypothetical protein